MTGLFTEEQYHSVIEYKGKRIIVCNGHFCNRDGELA